MKLVKDELAIGGCCHHLMANPCGGEWCRKRVLSQRGPEHLHYVAGRRVVGMWWKLEGSNIAMLIYWHTSKNWIEGYCSLVDKEPIFGPVFLFVERSDGPFHKRIFEHP